MCLNTLTMSFVETLSLDDSSSSAAALANLLLPCLCCFLEDFGAAFLAADALHSEVSWVCVLWKEHHFFFPVVSPF